MASNAENVSIWWRRHETEFEGSFGRIFHIATAFLVNIQTKFYIGCNYLCMLGLKLSHVSKRGHWTPGGDTNNTQAELPTRGKVYTLKDKNLKHYSDVIMGAMASQIISLAIVYPTVYSGADQRKHQTPRHWTLCEFPAQMASNAENVSIWWRHHNWTIWFWDCSIPE